MLFVWTPGPNRLVPSSVKAPASHLCVGTTPPLTCELVLIPQRRPVPDTCGPLIHGDCAFFRDHDGRAE